MGLFDTLGGAMALQGKPDSFIDEAMNNARMNRAEEERKRQLQAKQDKEAADKYASIAEKTKISGFDPIFNQEIQNKSAEVIGGLNDIYKRNKYEDPYTNKDWVKKYDDFQILLGNKKTEDAALKADLALAAKGEAIIKPEVAAALQSGDYQAFKSAIGGSGVYRQGAGIELKNKEKPFDYLEFKGKVNNAFKPFDKTIEYKDTNTGNYVTVENQYYNNPIAATNEVLNNDPKAINFFKNQYNDLSKEQQKKYSEVAQKEGGSGNAYLEYAKDRLFPEQGLKYKQTIQSESGKGSNKKVEVLPEKSAQVNVGVSSIGDFNIGTGGVEGTRWRLPKTAIVQANPEYLFDIKSGKREQGLGDQKMTVSEVVELPVLKDTGRGTDLIITKKQQEDYASKYGKNDPVIYKKFASVLVPIEEKKNINGIEKMIKTNVPKYIPYESVQQQIEEQGNVLKKINETTKNEIKSNAPHGDRVQTKQGWAKWNGEKYILE